MPLFFLLALAAGVTAALLYASIRSGVAIALVLFYLAPLPILIVAIGWSHLAALLAAIGATAGIGFALGFNFAAAFVLCAGLPAWWLGYLSLLGRPAAATGDAAVEWYPVGRLVLWSAICGAVAVAVGMLMVVAVAGYDGYREAMLTALRSDLERVFQAQGQKRLDGAQIERVIVFLVSVFPPLMAMMLTLFNLLNLWLAGRIVRMSGRLRRPWPDLAALALPGSAPLLLAAAIMGSLLPELPGVLARAFATTLFLAFALMGFAVLHAITRGMSSRAIALTAAYLAVFLLGWPIVAVFMLGLAETALNLRARFAGPGSPPAPRT